MEAAAEVKPETAIAPGLYDVDNATYHRGEGWKNIIGSSGMRQILRSPVHYKWLKEEGEEEKESFNFGSAYHLRILQPELFYRQVVAAPKCDKRTKEGKAVFERFQGEAAGKIVITQAEAEALEFMAAQMAESHTASAILKNPGYFERSAVWKDPYFEFMGKCRPDYDIPNLAVLVDLKSTVDASQERFSKSCGNYGYDVEAAWYVDGMRAATGIEYNTFIFIAQEKTAPYAVAIYQADPEFIGVGRVKITRASEIYKNCLETGRWPGYPDRVQKIYLPVWSTKGAAGLDKFN